MQLEKIDMSHYDQVEKCFLTVFTKEPWLDDWSNRVQLKLYLSHLLKKEISHSYGLFDGGDLIGLALGRLKYWYEGTELVIEEFCILPDYQGKGKGTYFLSQIKENLIPLGVKYILLHTEKHLPAFAFYKKQGFTLLENDVTLLLSLKS